MKKFILPLVLISPLLLYVLWAYIMPIFLVAYVFGGAIALTILGIEALCVISVLTGFIMIVRRIGR